MKLFTKIKIKDERELWFLNILLCRYSKVNKKSLIFFPRPYQNQVFDQMLSHIDSKHDSVFILNAGFGEIYLISFFFEDMLRKYNLKTPCFASYRDVSKELIGLFYPDIPFYVIKRSDKFSSIKQTNNTYKNKFIHINPCTAFEMINFWEDYLAGKENRHYVEAMTRFAGIQIKSKPSVFIKEQIKKSALIKAEKQNLNIDKFVVLFPQANFFSALNEDFCKTIKMKLNKAGYDILINNENFSIQEIFYLTSFSKGIIGARCGLCEVFSTLDIQKHIIYTKCKRKIPDILKVFSLKKYPFVNKDTVFEYEYSEGKQTLIIDKILNNF